MVVRHLELRYNHYCVLFSMCMQEELNELETMEPSSAACKEILLSTEGKPDAFLPVTPGPENAAWHRWFQRVRSPHSRKWWTHKGSSDIL
ncbi:hypothetical protein MUK42_33383 [Musa troglodytarum]|uniref:Uncharacterized protein n=1 Tax=Musa troglodytarum TaxID=320322 RepID=A0A9E7L142_9LILI|nr:hypothetical protein MUK42_33383 [Musa troglodytarum]